MKIKKISNISILTHKKITFYKFSQKYNYTEVELKYNTTSNITISNYTWQLEMR